eukprot:TRINITY_DN7717_c0_g1_i3.p1 TRINITY_DN7717_c0_g1~~TRINITY_DN7717_c0_g1_i3.p1  ORF type:complete len:421 (-),score=144.99 TRINITY_DN7717_c0_g1_i3:79-1341(-)
MRIPAASGRGGLVLLLLVMIAVISVKYSIDQSYIQVSQLNSQLSVLKARYRQLAGLDSAEVTEGEKAEGGSCSPKTQVAFAKTHKTGSSTLQNIFFRYGDAHGLTFAIPERSWMYSFKEPFNASMITSLPWAKLGFDLFIFHSVWNYPEVKKVLPEALYITLLRDPVNCYESNYVYMGLQNAFRMDINKFAQVKAAANVPRRPTAIIGKNQLLWDLGMPHSDMEDDQKVSEKISELDKQFDFVLLAEHFDESLVLLARLLCWDLSEVRYLKQNARKVEKVSNITAEARGQLTTWLAADFRLYKHYQDKFELEVEKYGRDQLDKDVATLRQLNEELTKDCVKEVADNSKLTGEFRMALDIVTGYVIDTSKPWCAPYARSEPNFSVQVRNKQKTRAGRARDKLLKGLDRDKLVEQRKVVQGG